MKRTRRVEVIRYRRHSTFVGDDTPLGTDSQAEQAALELLLGSTSGLEGWEERGRHTEPQATEVEVPSLNQRRRPLNFLKRLVKG